MRYTKDQIEEAVAGWQVRLGLSDWRYTFKIGRIQGAKRAAAVVEPEYRSVTFYFNPAGMERAGDDLDETVVHEWAHVINWHLGQLAERYAGEDPERLDRVNHALEEATTVTERVILHLTGGKP